jgi:vacuolar-type H+-ATPase subunit H
MSQDKDATPPERHHPVRDALGTATRLHAERMAVEHDVKNARDVVNAKVKAARAKAKVDIAEAKRDLQQRIDEARVDAHEKR